MEITRLACRRPRGVSPYHLPDTRRVLWYGLPAVMGPSLPSQAVSKDAIRSKIDPCSRTRYALLKMS